MQSIITYVAYDGTRFNFVFIELNIKMAKSIVENKFDLIFVCFHIESIIASNAQLHNKYCSSVT